MDIDPKDMLSQAETARNEREARSARLNAAVAVTIALLATFMGICKVKDDNIVQAMQQAQADKLDHWAFYQARNIRQEIAEKSSEYFEVITFDMTEDSQPRKMVAIRFPDDTNPDDFNPPRIAVLDVTMLAQGIIEMSEGNAWRGDRFCDELDQHFTINKKEVYQ